MSTSVIDPGKLMWKCECGGRVFNHYENCPACGRGQPKPKEEPPSDVALPEVA